MGDWAIVVEGTGAHHNKDFPKDADRMSQTFVDDLIRAGHTVRVATFTAGGRTVLDTIENWRATHPAATEAQEEQQREYLAGAYSAYNRLGLTVSPRNEPIHGTAPQSVPNTETVSG